METEQKDRVFIGIGCCLIAHFLFFIMGGVAKYLSDTHHVAEIVFYRNAIAFVPLFLFIVLRKKTHLLKTKEKRFIATRAILGSISLMITYAALSKLPMSYATVLFFMSTILTPAFSFFFLKEQVGIHRWSAVGIGMIGVFIIAQPSGEFDTTGMILALIAATMHAMMFTILRKLKTESPVTVTFFFIFGGAVLSGFFMPWVAKIPTQNELLLFLAVAASGGTAQLFLSNAYRFAPASVVTPFAYSALLWTVMADILVWKYDLDFTSIGFGAGLIISAQLYIVYREYHLSKIKKAGKNHD